MSPACCTASRRATMNEPVTQSHTVSCSYAAARSSRSPIQVARAGRRSEPTLSHNLRTGVGNRRIVGYTVPSGTSCRHPASPTPGRRARSSTNSPKVPETISTSGFKKRTNGDSDSANPRLLAYEKPAILAANHARLGKLTLDELGRPVGGCIVDHEHLDRRGAGMGVDGCQARPKPVLAIERDDDHR